MREEGVLVLPCKLTDEDGGIVEVKENDCGVLET